MFIIFEMIQFYLKQLTLYSGSPVTSYRNWDPITTGICVFAWNPDMLSAYQAKLEIFFKRKLISKQKTYSRYGYTMTTSWFVVEFQLQNKTNQSIYDQECKMNAIYFDSFLFIRNKEVLVTKHVRTVTKVLYRFYLSYV